MQSERVSKTETMLTFLFPNLTLYVKIALHSSRFSKTILQMSGNTIRFVAKQVS